MTGRQITSAHLSAAQVSDILALVRSARLTDGVEPLSEHVLLHLRYDSSDPDPDSSPDPAPGRDFVLTADGEIAGYAYLDPPVSRSGIGRQRRARDPPGPAACGRGSAGPPLAEELTAEAGGHALRLWAHGDLPAAAGLASLPRASRRFRALWQMRRPLADGLDQPVLPA